MPSRWKMGPFSALRGLVFGTIADGASLKRSGQAIVGFTNVFSQEFVSSDQTVSTSTVLTVPHSLGSVPKLVKVTLKNTTAELNYSVGDEVDVNTPRLDGAFQGSQRFAWDATNVIIFTDTRVFVPNKTSGGLTDITLGSWKWVVRAWL